MSPDLEVINVLDTPWSAGLVLLAAGAMLMVFGSRWRDFTEALSMSLTGGVAALLLTPHTAVNPLWIVVGVCLLLGVLTVLFRRVSLVVLTAVGLGVSLSLMANMLNGWPTAAFLVRSLSRDQVGVVVHIPDYVGTQWLLALLIGGMLAGVIVAIVSQRWARRVTMALGGSLAFLVGVVLVVRQFFSAHLEPGYPMKYSQVAAMVWVEVAVISLLMQRMADRPPTGAADEASKTTEK
jgi:hypothetical protein